MPSPGTSRSISESSSIRLGPQAWRGPRIARDLNIAVLRAADRKRGKVVHLLFWAGDDTPVRVPGLEWMSHSGEDGEDDHCEDDYYSAIELAAFFDRGAMLRLLKPHPARDDFATLYQAADNVE